MTSPFPGLETKSSGLTIFLSFFCPGLGHIYLGRIIRGVLMMLVTVVLYFATYAGWEQASRESQASIAIYQSAYEHDTPPAGVSKLDYASQVAHSASKQAQMWAKYALIFLGVSFVWWVSVMIFARRLCGQHNLKVFRLSAMGPEEIRRTFDRETSGIWTRRVLNVLKRARAEFGEFWSGDPRLPYQGWFGRLAKDHVIVAETLVASLFGNVAWLVFSIRNKWFRASAEQLLDEFKRGLPHAHSEGYQMLTLLGWGLAAMAMLFAAMLLIGIVYASVMWFRVSLRSEQWHEPGKGRK